MTPGFLPTLEEQALLPTFDLQLKGGGSVFFLCCSPERFLGEPAGEGRCGGGGGGGAAGRMKGERNDRQVF